MNFKYLYTILVFLSICITHLQAAYKITGQVKLSSEWQPQVFLSTINKLDDYYKANPNDIIQVAFIGEDGRFTLSGDNLPPEARYYRLYLIKEENSELNACLYVGNEDHNFLHLILDNDSQIDILSDTTSTAPFGAYTLKGDQANKQMRELSRLIYPSYYFHQIKFPTELQYTQEKLNRDLLTFADTCQNTLVGLAAIINTDFDQYFELEESAYQAFGQRLQRTLKAHSYTKDYFRKLLYYKGTAPNTIPNWMKGILGILSFLLCAAVYHIYILRTHIGQLKDSLEQQAIASQLVKPSFTNQEEKILLLIQAGKSNKEIAATLFIGLSTVKTHINKLYAKLGVKNRTEAKNLANTWFSEGG